MSKIERAGVTLENLPTGYLEHLKLAPKFVFGNTVLKPGSQFAPIICGALSMAYRLADPEHSTEVYDPWLVRSPMLLDPVIWVVAAAYVEADR